MVTASNGLRIKGKQILKSKLEKKTCGSGHLQHENEICFSTIAKVHIQF